MQKNLINLKLFGLLSYLIDINRLKYILETNG